MQRSEPHPLPKQQLYTHNSAQTVAYTKLKKKTFNKVKVSKGNFFMIY